MRSDLLIGLLATYAVLVLLCGIAIGLALAKWRLPRSFSDAEFIAEGQRRLDERAQIQPVDSDALKARRNAR